MKIETDIERAIEAQRARTLASWLLANRTWFKVGIENKETYEEVFNQMVIDILSYMRGEAGTYPLTKGPLCTCTVDGDKVEIHDTSCLEHGVMEE